MVHVGTGSYHVTKQLEASTADKLEVAPSDVELLHCTCSPSVDTEGYGGDTTGRTFSPLVALATKFPHCMKTGSMKVHTAVI